MEQRLLTQARLYMDQAMEKVEIHSLAKGTAAIYTRFSPEKAGGNEDSAALIPLDENSGVLVVADGMGGMRAGEQASGLAVQAVGESVEKAAEKGMGLREAILNGIEKANQRISAMGIGAGTTLAVVEIEGRTVRPYHVGDSMIMVVGQKGKIKLQTVSHSPVSYAVEAGLLDQDEAMNHEERHLVSNIIGSSDMRIEVGATLNMAERDTLLLASDGLFDNLRPDEIVEGMRKGPLDKIVHDLVRRCLERMQNTDNVGPSKPDDLTLILFRRNSGVRKPTS